MDATLQDLAEDLSAQAELFESGVQRLTRFCELYASIDSSAHTEAKQHILHRARLLQTDFLTQATARREHLSQQQAWTSNSISSLLSLKREGGGWLRTLYGELGSVLASSDWQSPSFLHAIKNHAGTQAGKIVGTMNDYKRDGHLDAIEFETQFREEYIDAPMQLAPHVCVTSSGMAAFSTLLMHLACNRPMIGPILVGASSYFENKIMLEKFFPHQIEYVDECDTEAIVARAKEVRPCAIFLDTLCNTFTLAMPDLKSLIPKLLHVLSHDAALILDNSTLSVSCQPLVYNPMLGMHATIYVVESLNKFTQFGLDRVTGGVIWNSGGFLIGVKEIRKHGGTIIQDASVLSIPSPNRARLNKRLARLGRNAQILAEHLDGYLKKNPNRYISHIVYPSLPSSPAYQNAKDLAFKGSFFVFAFKPHKTQLPIYNDFVKNLLEEAKQAGVEIISSTSFGFDTTRIYVTAVHATKFTKPFIRISVGSETMQEIETLKRIFESAIQKL